MLLSLFYDFAEQIIPVGVDLNHAPQIHTPHSFLFAVRNHTNCPNDLWNSSSPYDRCDQVGACEPDWRLGGKVIVPDILRDFVVHGTHWQDVFIGHHKGEEPQFLPS